MGQAKMALNALNFARNGYKKFIKKKFNLFYFLSIFLLNLFTGFFVECGALGRL